MLELCRQHMDCTIYQVLKTSVIDYCNLIYRNLNILCVFSCSFQYCQNIGLYYLYPTEIKDGHSNFYFYYFRAPFIIILGFHMNRQYFHFKKELQGFTGSFSESQLPSYHLPKCQLSRKSVIL